MQSAAVSIFVLIVGFILLIKGADFFVEGSSSVAKRLRVPSIIIGLTIVAMGTSLPECAVSVAASVSGSNTLAISNVVGSNIFNLMVVCGVCALFNRLPVHADTLKKEFPFSIVCAGILLICGYSGMLVNRSEGIIMLIIFAAYILWMVMTALKDRKIAMHENSGGKYRVLALWKCALYIIGGMAAIKFGGDFVVDGAVEIASLVGISDTLIGLTVVALGTSLPELVTSIVAARKNEVDIAVGNVIGSNIFNILFVLGIAGTISPMGFIANNIIDTAILIFVSLLTLLLAWRGKKIGRFEGAVMIAVYTTYMCYICMR